MTVSEQQTTPAPAVGIAPAQPRRGHLLDVLAKVREKGAPQFEPDRMRADRSSGLLELEFDEGPTPVVAWSVALGFDRPTNVGSPELRQTIVESHGEVFGWRVEIRHVHTARLGRHVAQAAHRRTADE